MASYSLVWNLGKQVQGLAFSGEVWLEHFSTLQGSIQFEGICLLKVLIREAENQGIPSRAMLELGHCCTVYLVIVWSVSWHHLLSGVGKKGTYLLLSLHPWNRDWFRILTVQFCSDFLNLHYKEIAKCVRQIFQRVRVGVCSCCNGFVSDLMISKSFF